MFANEVDWKGAAADLWHGLLNLTPKKAWNWLTYGPGSMRLVYLVVIIPLILWLSGCASTGPTVNGTEYAVTVNWANASSSSTIQTAQAHCAQYGRNAQFAGKPNAYTDAYNCVKP